MSNLYELYRCIPNFPNYTETSFAYPERLILTYDGVFKILGPPLHLYYGCQPPRSNTLHISNIPNWATMSDIVKTFETFGKIYTIELSIDISPILKYTNLLDKRASPPIVPLNIFGNKEFATPEATGWAMVTFTTYESAQKALFQHLSLKLPEMTKPLSIYKSSVNNVVLLKNLPKSPKAEILAKINDYHGLISISFIKTNIARMVFADLDYALLFMDIVSSGGLIIDGFTSTCEPEDKDNEDDDDDSN